VGITICLFSKKETALMFKVFRKLYAARIIAPIGFYTLTKAILYSGVNLMAMLRFTAALYPKNIAITDENEETTYLALLKQAEQLSVTLKEKYNVIQGQKAAIICRNHTSLINSLFSLSYLGADIYLLNIEMSTLQFKALLEKYNFDLIIHDQEVSGLIADSAYNGKTILSYHTSLPSVYSLARSKSSLPVKIKKSKPGKIIVLTGGTTGNAKMAIRKPSIFDFLNPFFALLVKVNLNTYKSVYIATPIYHGFGLASVFISVILGKQMFLLQKFEAQQACSLIKNHKIEVTTLVPLMLQRMINQNITGLDSLKCIISGGAPLNPTLVNETFDKLGNKLFNLYGTSEAGFCIMATPDDLRYSSNTIGRELQGVKLTILDKSNNEVKAGEVGRLCIKSKWISNKESHAFIETGDLGYKDNSGYYFLCGRTDDMIVSGGENVYPVELENILLNHPGIKQVAVIGIPDADFGQRLKVYIVPAENNTLTKEEITNWLSSKAARFQMPKQIEFIGELPYTALGKVNKKALK
jgi:fatty-acyl-CoA synthase